MTLFLIVRRCYAAICASPAVVFQKHNLFDGVSEMTCHPNFTSSLPSTNSADKRVVVDGICITRLFVIRTNGFARNSHSHTNVGTHTHTHTHRITETRTRTFTHNDTFPMGGDKRHCTIFFSVWETYTTLISGGPGTAIEFALKIVEQLFDRQKAEQVAKPMLVPSW